MHLKFDTIKNVFLKKTRRYFEVLNEQVVIISGINFLLLRELRWVGIFRTFHISLK